MSRDPVLGPVVSVNGVVSICRGHLDQRQNPGDVYCGRVATWYVLTNGRWVALCGRHCRAFTVAGYRMMRIDE